MSYLKRPQLVTLIVAALVVVLLLLLPRTGDVQGEDESKIEDQVSTDYRVDALNSLSASDRKTYDEIQGRIDKTEDPLQKIDLIDSLSNFWESKENILMAADQLNEIAIIINDKPSYFIAGDKYYKAFTQLNDDRKRIALDKAIQSYETVLELLPEDLEAMTSLGVCYVEGASVLGEAPMKGIGMLRKVLEIDPDNINALINMGYFARQSGQYDKAIERFKKVLEINPNFTDAYLYLSDTYLQMGENEEAAKSLEEFKELVEDPEIKQQLEIYIDNIRNNNI